MQIADRLFYEQGYQATGINQIISEAGVAKASFYQHFPSKEELALAYVQNRSQQILTGLRQATAERTGLTEALNALFDALEAFVGSTQFGGCAFQNLAVEFPVQDSAIRRAVADHKRNLRALIAGLVGRELPLETPPAVVQQKGDAVFVLFEGALMESRVMFDLWPVHAARAAAFDLLG